MALTNLFIKKNFDQVLQRRAEKYPDEPLPANSTLTELKVDPKYAEEIQTMMKLIRMAFLMRYILSYPSHQGKKNILLDRSLYKNMIQDPSEIDYMLQYVKFTEKDDFSSGLKLSGWDAQIERLKRGRNRFSEWVFEELSLSQQFTGQGNNQLDPRYYFEKDQASVFDYLTRLREDNNTQLQVSLLPMLDNYMNFYCRSLSLRCELCGCRNIKVMCLLCGHICCLRNCKLGKQKHMDEELLDLNSKLVLQRNGKLFKTCL